MRRKAIWAIAVIGVLGIAAGPFVLRGVLRHRTIDRLLGNIPHGRERITVMPTIKTLATVPTAVHSVNLGYATFDMGTNAPIYITAEEMHTAVVITNADFGFRFAGPFGVGELKNSTVSLEDIAARARAGSRLARYVETQLSDMVASQIEMEQTQLLPFSRTTLLLSDDFSLYLLKLTSKARNNWGSNEIWSFTTPYIKGIVRVGQGPTDRQRAVVYLASLDGSRNLTLMAVLLHGSTKDIGAAIEPILASFQFTIDKVPDNIEIMRLISKAGIPMR